jgi:hypothetical protein
MSSSACEAQRVRARSSWRLRCLAKNLRAAVDEVGEAEQPEDGQGARRLKISAPALLEQRKSRVQSWRKRLGVEPSLPAKRGATGFEDREGHRAPFASVTEMICCLGDLLI